MRRVLVTHVDSAIGRRLVKTLYHDPDVSLMLGLGVGPPPSYLDAYREKCVYQRLDLVRARHAISFFRSERFERAKLDSVIHLPPDEDGTAERIPGNVPAIVAETRRLLEACAEAPDIARFIYLSSAFVYRPEPGNVNVMSEEQLLDLEADAAPEVRSWIDADLICQGELGDPRLRVTILRAATIVTEAGECLHSPPVERAGAVGFDPMVSVISDRDVARALVLALHSERSGIFNVSGRESFPRSTLVRRPAGLLAGPRRVTGVLSALGQGLGLVRSRDPGYKRYGIMLDTHRAADVLGFEPQYRLELRRHGSTHRLDTVRCR